MYKSLFSRLFAELRLPNAFTCEQVDVLARAARVLDGLDAAHRAGGRALAPRACDGAAPAAALSSAAPVPPVVVLRAGWLTRGYAAASRMFEARLFHSFSWISSDRGVCQDYNEMDDSQVRRCIAHF